MHLKFFIKKSKREDLTFNFYLSMENIIRLNKLSTFYDFILKDLNLLFKILNIL